MEGIDKQFASCC